MQTLVPFQCLESVRRLGQGITRESWFITNPSLEGFVRRVVYKNESGKVVAFQDEGKNISNDLYVERVFYEFNREGAWLQVQCNSGVYAVQHIKLFDMG